jgi:5-methylcytosine-specific restriction endonuclease McrA
MIRTPIPDESAAEVMFLSDRTCCVCRDPKRKTEIHHIDGDPTNNMLDNLAVICKDCHSDAHTT